jgi:hypothetical protein
LLNTLFNDAVPTTEVTASILRYGRMIVNDGYGRKHQSIYLRYYFGIKFAGRRKTSGSIVPILRPFRNLSLGDESLFPGESHC